MANRTHTWGNNTPALNVSYACCGSRAALFGRVTHLVLPVDTDAARVELAVEVVVGAVQADPFDGGELVNVLQRRAGH